MTAAVTIPSRPMFLEKLSHYQQARLSRCIALTGNIHDLFGVKESGESSEVKFMPLEDVLLNALQNARSANEQHERFIVMVLKSNGIHFVSEQDKTHLTGVCNLIQSKLAKRGGEPEKGSDELTAHASCFKDILAEIEKRDGTSLAAMQKLASFLREMAKIRELLVQTKLFVTGEKGEEEYYIRPICVVIDQAHMVLPNLTVREMSAQDREIWKVTHELLCDEAVWPSDETAGFLQDFIILLSPTIAELNPALFNLPKTVSCDVLPTDEPTRKVFSVLKLARFAIPDFYGYKDEDLERAIEEFARDTGGLTLRTLDDLLTEAHRDPEGFRLTRKSVTAEGNRRLEIALGDTIKLVRPEHTEKDLRGGKSLWSELEYVANWADDPKRAPYGIIVPGPNDAGKTYTLEAWSVYTGRTVLEIAGGMRNPYYGQTDIYAERLEYHVSAYNKVCILVDEAHKAFGSIHSRDTFQAEASLARHIIKMSGNPKYRSKIFWVFITTRPDLLDPDFRRRFSVGVPVFDPEGEDAEDFFAWMIENFTESGIALLPEEMNLLKKKTRESGREFSAGDYKGFMDEYITRRDFFRKKSGSDLSIKDFAKDWNPKAVKLGQERVLQIYLAGRYCSSPDKLFPKRLRKEDGTPMDAWELDRKIQELRLEVAFEN